MKNLLYILIFLAYSCEEIQETVEDLPYDFLISEGWQNFEEGNLSSSEDLFLDILDFDEGVIPYYSAAYLGLGWIKLYQAKELANGPIDNFNEMKDLRSDANNYFNLILGECDYYDQECTNSDIPEELIFDTYAGLTYSYSLFNIYDNFDTGERFNCIINNQTHDTISECESNCEQYTCAYDNYDTESSCETECVDDSGCTLIHPCFNMANTALKFSDLLLEHQPNYYFDRDSDNINSNSMHLLRAQLYIHLNDYTSAESELYQIDFITSDITFTLVDSYQDPYDSYDRYLYIGFEGNNNSKHYIPMNTELYESSYLSSVTAFFTPLLPCLYTYGSDAEIQIDLSNEDIVQCLESFPTHTLEYKFAIRYPNSIFYGYECSTGSLDIYDTLAICNPNCTDGECSLVDIDVGNCQTDHPDSEYIDGIGCIDAYMYDWENIEGQSCSEGGYRVIDIIGDNLSLSSSSLFDSCTSD